MGSTEESLLASDQMEVSFDGTEVTVFSEEMEGSYLSAKPPLKKKKCKNCAEQCDTAKKPRSAYLLYYYDIYLKVQQEIPHLPQSEINKKISESWKLLSVAEKSHYLERAKLEKEGLDSNIKSSPSSLISDVPGFRRILPRTDYILIPKRSTDDDKNIELCVTQPQASTIMSPLSQNGLHNSIPVDSGKICLSEQCINIGCLVKEGTSFGTVDVVQEVNPCAVFTNYSTPVADKMSLDDVTLEIGNSSPYQTTDVVIEENGGISQMRQEVPAGLSLMTVMAIQDTEENCLTAPATQFIMVPVPSHSTLEKPKSVKLSTTYTRRGRGCCTNPGCSFTYVTRHKPLKCPMCNRVLGGKWVPKTPQVKETFICTPSLPAKVSDCMEAKELCYGTKNGSESTKENTEAVHQLLHSSPPTQVEEWEEVIVSDVHILPDNARGSTEVVEAPKRPGSMLEEKRETVGHMTEAQPVAENTKVTCQVPGSKASLLSSPSPQNLKETKCAPKSRLAPLISRPIRAILPAPAKTVQTLSGECAAGTLTILTTEIPASIKAAGLKPSTLKQLGQSVVPQAISQEITDLGLATLRGKGKCKNIFCNYMYTNRHKPKTCPKCGSNLKDNFERLPKLNESPLHAPSILNVSMPLSQAQKETQRQSTIQLLRKTVQFPENECELSEAFAIIHELNSSCLILSNVIDGTVTIEQTSWARFYESSADQCLLCGSPLFKGEKNSQAGPQDCWLLTVSKLQMVTTQAKLCLNLECLAIHSFNDIFTGLFNVGNKLLVSLDILFSIRNQIKHGEDPKEFITNLLTSIKEQAAIPEKMLTPEVLSSVHDLLSCGYWAFECLTVRDFNDMICGICGVAPKVELAQRNAGNTLTLSNIELTWPEFMTSNKVNMDDFWSSLENEVLEQAAFPSSIPISKFDASIVAPFFPPLMRGPVVFNSESYKNPEVQKVPGNGSSLMRLLQERSLKLDQLNQHSTAELQKMLTLCGIPWNTSDTKDKMCYSLLALSEFVQNGTQIKQPQSHLTGGKLYKVCPHQVVCGSKYIVRGESPRDHVDLLASSRHWPPVYVVDMATQVSLCADLCYPNLTQQMWGKNQGCFTDPSQTPKYVSCPELLDRHYSMNVTRNDTSIQHPVTKLASRRIVHAMAEQKGSCDPTSQHHSLYLCRELEPYGAIITAMRDSKTSNIRHNQINFENATHYYLYNRLMDFLTSREIVNRQINDIVQSCQPGEVVIRDNLCRLGVAQIKTETAGNDFEEEIVQEQTKCI
ncbi:HMG-box containing 3 L homeolog isoform X3 [Xenopus laevis]|uniref:HMG-box containing 3 L homeolog isoform X3 n=2 Tax=Xenopus laevis TaxID=8355 RepID=A0A8J0UNZ8_XENLA|nr:HMG-box containing 3 L homeolog isoform X3 [Xenopus laevis]